MPTFDRHDICAAWNLYATVWHDGQGSDAYRIHARLARIGFKPGRSEERLCGLSPNAREIYAALVERNHSTGYVQCACCGLDTIGVEGVALCAYCEDGGCRPRCSCESCAACRHRECQAPQEDECDHEALPRFTDLGAYPIAYLCRGEVLCASCATEELRSGEKSDAFVHWEGEPIECDGCNGSIESAYGPVHAE
jgi:hypothetical protein